MKLPKKPTALLLENAVDLMFEIYLLRGDCSTMARALMSRPSLDEPSLEECARLDDTLAKAYRSLQHTVRSIHASHCRRRHRSRG